MEEISENKKTWFQKYQKNIKMLLPFRIGKENLNWMTSLMWKASRTRFDLDQIKTIRKEIGVVANSTRPETQLVLQGLNIVIQSGEKVGIIGRTGAGKSSILAALLRLTEVHEGAILIDDVDISKIGLQDLRRKMAVIPQDPVLLSGTVRFNLDPFNKYTDEQIWETLEKCNLTTKIRNEPLQLEMTINPENGMFSLGEKQLFCLARALLKNSKILLLDEATASVDLETDQLVQKSIRNCFRNCTVLTIAHRLNTIVDYDKILTMEAGKVLEFDTPKRLLSTSSVFRSMLNAQI